MIAEDRLAPVSALVLTALLLLVLAMPFGRTDEPFLRPMVPIMFTYYFTVEQPRRLPLIALALLGLLQDILTGGILGLNMTLLLITRLLLELQLPTFQTWPALSGWPGFVPVAAVAGLIGWIVGCIYAAGLQPPMWVLFQTAVTIATYPLFAVMFARLDRGGQA
ncbi:MAG: rod shape-determining protein MreD [Rhodothalassiaceae bacterium]